MEANPPLDLAVRAALLERRGQWLAIAARCNVSHSWLSKFVNGRIDNPGYGTLMRLHRELIGTEGAPAVPAEEARDAA